MRAVVYQKLKLLVLQCATAESPPASPTKPLRSRRRRALKKLHVLSRFHRLIGRADCSGAEQKQDVAERVSGPLLNHTLKDLFASPLRHDDDDDDEEEYGCGRCNVVVNCRVHHVDATSGVMVWRTAGVAECRETEHGGAGGWSTWPFRSVLGLRRRLLRRAWRPVLVAIPESESFL